MQVQTREDICTQGLHIS